MPNRLWSSDRLVYRVPELDDADIDFAYRLNSNEDDWGRAIIRLPVQSSKKDCKAHLESLRDKCIIGALICIPEDPKNKILGKQTPIGALGLFCQDQRQSYNRFAEIYISIVPEYQSKGYGSEAIRWLTEWGFQYANLHRVEIRTSSYNPGAAKLYEKLGFILDGRLREQCYREGQYWDTLEFALLENEWREKNAARRGSD